MRVFKKSRLVAKSAFLLALCLTVSLVLSGPAPSAKAVYFSDENPSAPSRYASMIDWIDWDNFDSEAAQKHVRSAHQTQIEMDPTAGGAAGLIPHDFEKDKPFKSYYVKSERTINNSGGRVSKVITRCSVTPVYVEINKPTQSKPKKPPRRSKPRRPGKGPKSPVQPKQSDPKTTGIAVHAPGGYDKDPFPQLYGSDRVVGIGRKDRGQSTMEVICKSVLQRANGDETTIPIEGLVFADGESTNRRYYTERKAPHYGVREFFEMTPYVPNDETNGHKANVQWKFLEYKPGIGGNGADDFRDCKTEVRRGEDNAAYRKIGRGSGNLPLYTRSTLYKTKPDALKGDDNVRVRGWNRPCTSKIDDEAKQPFVSVYAEGATGAYLDLYGAGGNYVAVGVVLGVDFGDAPNSYGVAGAVIQPNIEGGVIPYPKSPDGSKRSIDTGDNITEEEKELTSPNKDGVTEFSQDFSENVFNNLEGGKPHITYEHKPYLGKHGPDGDLNPPRGNSLTPDQQKVYNFLHDDKSIILAANRVEVDATEEDALGDGRSNLLVYAAAGTSYYLDVPCAADSDRNAYVYGWLDWNGNGSFDEDTEKAQAQCTNSSAHLTWTVKDGMLPDASKGSAVRSALRLIATTDTDVTATGVYSDGEVEDHAATLIRPKLTLHKQLTDQNGDVQDSPTAPIVGWKFTAEDSDKISALNADLPTAVTDASGDAVYQLKAKTTDPLPLDVRDNKGDLDLSFVETPQSNYSLATFSNAKCALAPRPTTDDWKLTGNDTPYAWPEVAPEVSNDNGKVKVSGTKAAILSSGVTCNVKNKPAGTFSVTPTAKVDEAPGAGSALKSDIKFKGTFSCSTTGANPVTVTGDWGPVANGQPWTYQNSADNPSIPLGAKCAITQTNVTESDGVTPLAEPIKGPDQDLYGWGPVEYDPGEGADKTQSGTVTAANATLGNKVPNFDINYHVVKRVTSVSWTKANPLHAVLKGAEFSLTKPGEATPVQITDCVANRDADCTGPDKNHEAGKFKVEKMPVGDYQLTETKAPLGYKASTIPSFTVTNEDIRNNGKNLGEIVNKPYSSGDLPTLPLTGGASTDSFLIAGGLVGLLSLGLAYAAKRRRARA